MATSKKYSSESSKKIPYDDFVRSVRPDPKNIEPLVLMQGYAGASSEPDHFRLYTDEALNNFVDLPEASVVYCEKNSPEENPRGGCKVWLKKDTIYTYGNPTQANRPKANFLEGDIMSNFRGGGTIAPETCVAGTINPCLIGTVGCVTRTNPCLGFTDCGFRTMECIGVTRDCGFGTTCLGRTQTCIGGTDNCGFVSTCIGRTNTCVGVTKGCGFVSTCLGGTQTCFGRTQPCIGGTLHCQALTQTCIGGTQTCLGDTPGGCGLNFSTQPPTTFQQTIVEQQTVIGRRGTVMMPTPTEPVWTPTSPVIQPTPTATGRGNASAYCNRGFNPYAGY